MKVVLGLRVESPDFKSRNNGLTVYSFEFNVEDFEALPNLHLRHVIGGK